MRPADATQEFLRREPHYAHNRLQLMCRRVTPEERFAAQHFCEDAPHGPYVDLVIVVGEFAEELGGTVPPCLDVACQRVLHAHACVVVVWCGVVWRWGSECARR